eukprot:TRINITY_DN7015_c0_g2_i1.p1 TRINITY_DN7015_c0_g2~~TRINITY_DN7015_c0_g2_i1.p1  ORF type:complete len:792 (-),score=214.01 TRINITY_DN7015_c0_g2_i1:85-2460(-)
MADDSDAEYPQVKRVISAPLGARRRPSGASDDSRGAVVPQRSLQRPAVEVAAAVEGDQKPAPEEPTEPPAIGLQGPETQGLADSAPTEDAAISEQPAEEMQGPPASGSLEAAPEEPAAEPPSAAAQRQRAPGIKIGGGRIEPKEILRRIETPEEKSDRRDKKDKKDKRDKKDKKDKKDLRAPSGPAFGRTLSRADIDVDMFASKPTLATPTRLHMPESRRNSDASAVSGDGSAAAAGGGGGGDREGGAAAVAAAASPGSDDGASDAGEDGDAFARMVGYKPAKANAMLFELDSKIGPVEAPKEDRRPKRTDTASTTRERNRREDKEDSEATIARLKAELEEAKREVEAAKGEKKTPRNAKGDSRHRVGVSPALSVGAKRKEEGPSLSKALQPGAYEVNYDVAGGHLLRALPWHSSPEVGQLWAGDVVDVEQVFAVPTPVGVNAGAGTDHWGQLSRLRDGAAESTSLSAWTLLQNSAGRDFLQRVGPLPSETGSAPLAKKEPFAAAPVQAIDRLAATLLATSLRVDLFTHTREVKPLSFTTRPIGLRFDEESTQLKVDFVQPGSPAQAAGVEAGWVLLRVGDQEVSKLPAQEARKAFEDAVSLLPDRDPAEDEWKFGDSRQRIFQVDGRWSVRAEDEAIGTREQVIWRQAPGPDPLSYDGGQNAQRSIAEIIAAHAKASALEAAAVRELQEKAASVNQEIDSKILATQGGMAGLAKRAEAKRKQLLQDWEVVKMGLNLERGRCLGKLNDVRKTTGEKALARLAELRLERGAGVEDLRHEFNYLEGEDNLEAF